MAFERFTGSQTDAVVSAADLTGKEFFAAKRTSSGLALCAAGDAVAGIISEGKAAGLHSSIKTGNQLKAIAGAAVAVGAKVTPDSQGRLVTATAGTEVFGTATTAAGAAGDLFTVDVDRSGIDIPA